MSEEFDLLGKGWEDIPDEVEADVPSYFKTPVGIWIMAFGRMMPKFKDINNKACEQGTPGSSFSHASVPLWLIETHGTAQAPKKETVLGMSLTIPEGKKVSELYYNLFISWEKGDQWKNTNMFKDFELKGIPNSKVVVPNPSGQGKVVRLKSLQYYYGRLVQLNVLWSDKENPYIDTKNTPVKILDGFIKPEVMVEFESKINVKVEAERAARKPSQEGGYTAPTSEEFNADANNLNDFLNS